MEESGRSITAETAEQRYRRMLGDSAAEVARLESVDGRYAAARLVLFALALATLSFAYFANVSSAVSVVGWLLFATFILAVILNEPIRDAIERVKRDAEVTAKLLARLQRDWDKLGWPKAKTQLATVRLNEHQKDVADDLDLLGKSSLFQFVSMTGTSVGARKLAHWLTGAADAETAKGRSEAILRLAPRRADRHRFYALAKHVGEGTGDPDEFLEWSGSPDWLPRYPWLMPWANLSAVIAVVATVVLVGSRFGLVPVSAAQTALITWGVLVAVNFLLTTLLLGPAHQIFSVAMASRGSVDEFRELFHAAGWLQRDSSSNDNTQLSRIENALTGDSPTCAEQGMTALHRVAAMGSLRQSALTFLIYLPLQAFALWDVRVLKRLERWKATYGEQASEWFDCLGELEALMSLAAIHDENPDWTFPNWDTSPSCSTFQSVALGHPLLRDDQRVCNDVTIGPAGRVLLVTGSNMSGKSTMLRSVGLNVALAGAGAPVCAREMSLPSVELATSIRVRDNLAEGISFYMAELHRLKGVVDHARQLRDAPGRMSLFLLDEILQGTNSRERQIAVTRVLEHLLSCQAIGAISTHDLELADEPTLMAVSDTVHFRETITPDAEGKEQMTFDYQMRQGVSPTTNALRLLEIVGLTDETE